MALCCSFSVPSTSGATLRNASASSDRRAVIFWVRSSAWSVARKHRIASARIIPSLASWATRASGDRFGGRNSGAHLGDARRHMSRGTVMNSIAAGLLLSAVLALGQGDRVFHFEHTSNVKDMDAIATSIRTIDDISQIRVDDGQQTLTLGGSAEQLKLAEWMFNELDAPQNQSAAVLQFRVQSG